jgi:SAM-dependent methyltransferase
VWTPARRRGREHLDDPTLDPAVAARSLRDVALANALFGGRRAALGELAAHFAAAARSGVRSLSLLDVGTGLGDIPRAARAAAARHGVALRTIGLEVSAALAATARGGAGLALAGDARALPFAAGSVDLVTCCQVLHHLDDEDAGVLLAELDRVARRGVVVSDLRRSWLAAGLLWGVSFPLRFHPVSRHDGVLSIFRGFTADELRQSVLRATGRRPAVRHRLGWRITARWSPA